MPLEAAGTGTDPEASWGHRNVGRSVQEGECSSATISPPRSWSPTSTARPCPSSPAGSPSPAPATTPPPPWPACSHDAGRGIALGDIIADSGYSHRVPATWANPLRAAGAHLVQDLHPHDRGPRGTYHGAIIANGNLYCPATPPLLDLVPLPPGAPAADAAAHDQQTAELARYKLGVHAADDADGYRRHACPAAAGKSAARCAPNP